MSRRKRIVVALLAVAVLAGSWFAWSSEDASVDFSDMYEEMIEDNEYLEDAYDAIIEGGYLVYGTVTFAETGWDGAVTVAFIKAPNFIAVLAGVLMGLLALIPSRGRWTAIVALQLAGYGTLHLGVLTVSLASEERMQLAGWLTLAAFLLATVVLSFGVREQLERYRKRRRKKARARAARA